MVIFFPGRTKVFFNRAGPLGRQKVLPVLRGVGGGNLEGRGAMMHELIRQNVKSVHYFSQSGDIIYHALRRAMMMFIIYRFNKLKIRRPH